MDFKDYSKYSDNEKKILLRHWWNYYGKMVYTFDEMMEFDELLEENVDDMFTLAILAYEKGMSSEAILKAIRDERIDEYKKDCLKTKENKDKEEYKKIEQEFIREIVKTFNDPRKNEFLDKGKMLMQVIDLILGNSNAMISKEEVFNLIDECSIPVSEYDDNGPLKDYILKVGLSGVYFFDVEKINENKEKIVELIEKLNLDDDFCPWQMIGIDKKRKQWTYNFFDIDSLIILGLAADVLEFSKPREEWSEYENYNPLIRKKKENYKTEVSGVDKNKFYENLEVINETYNISENYVEEFKEMVRKMKNRENNLTEKEKKKNKLDIFSEQETLIKPVFEMLGYKIESEKETINIYNKNEQLIKKVTLEDMEKLPKNVIIDIFDNNKRLSYSYEEEKVEDEVEIKNNIVFTNLDKERKVEKEVKLEIEKLKDDEEIDNFNIIITNLDSEDVETVIGFGPSHIFSQISNYSEQYGLSEKENYKKRLVYFEDIALTPFRGEAHFIAQEEILGGLATAVVVESELDEENQEKYYLRLNTNDENCENKVEETEIDVVSADSIARSLLAVDRIKTVINRAMWNLEKEIPGSMDFFSDKFAVIYDVKECMEEKCRDKNLIEGVKTLEIKEANFECENVKRKESNKKMTKKKK